LHTLSDSSNIPLCDGHAVGRSQNGGRYPAPQQQQQSAAPGDAGALAALARCGAMAAGNGCSVPGRARGVAPGRPTAPPPPPPSAVLPPNGIHRRGERLLPTALAVRRGLFSLQLLNRPTFDHKCTYQWAEAVFVSFRIFR